MIPVASSRPSYLRALFVSVIGSVFVGLSIYSMCEGSFRMRRREAEVTSTSDPVLFWGLLSFALLLGLVALYAAYRDVRFLTRRRKLKLT